MGVVAVEQHSVQDDRAADALSLDTAFYFADGIMKDYAGDDVPVAEWEKDKEKYAIRIAAVEGLRSLRDTWTRTKGDGATRLRETFAGEADDKTKKLIEDEQTVPARIELDLIKLLRKFESAAPRPTTLCCSLTASERTTPRPAISRASIYLTPTLPHASRWFVGHNPPFGVPMRSGAS